jgi:hypothetical protein
VSAAGLVDLPGARLGYLQLAVFHGYLELAVLVANATSLGGGVLLRAGFGWP